MVEFLLPLLVLGTLKNKGNVLFQRLHKIFHVFLEFSTYNRVL
jgi:hypothetical protein